MIEEQYVSFETAKLAKEKGFDIPTRYGFSERRSLVRVDTSDNWNQDKELYSRPTQSLLARWLREKHNMCIEILSTAYGFIWFISNTDSGTCRYCSNDIGPFEAEAYNTYEKAMENGLQYALNLLNKELWNKETNNPNALCFYD